MRASDATLVRQLAAEPSGEGLRTLYRRYGAELYGFARNALGDPGLAEEVVQDAFISVWRNADRFDPARASFRTWLYELTRNRIVDLRRPDRGSSSRGATTSSPSWTSRSSRPRCAGRSPPRWPG
jgi:RNA polymerase sigma factor (sigma-70 family)